MPDGEPSVVSPSGPARPAPAPRTFGDGALVEGQHVGKFELGRDRALAVETLKAFTQAVPWAADFLATAPLAALKFKRSIPAKGVSGMWKGSAARGMSIELSVSIHEKHIQFGALGSAFVMSDMAPTSQQGLLRTLLHEFGHHIHRGDYFTNRARANVVDATIGVAYRSPAANPVTRYARSSRAEYFAESFVAFVVDPTALMNHDFEGYRMVEDVLTMRGITPTTRQRP